MIFNNLIVNNTQPSDIDIIVARAHLITKNEEPQQLSALEVARVNVENRRGMIFNLVETREVPVRKSNSIEIKSKISGGINSEARLPSDSFQQIDQVYMFPPVHDGALIEVNTGTFSPPAHVTQSILSEVALSIIESLYNYNYAQVAESLSSDAKLELLDSIDLHSDAQSCQLIKIGAKLNSTDVIQGNPKLYGPLNTLGLISLGTVVGNIEGNAITAINPEVLSTAANSIIFELHVEQTISADVRLQNNCNVITTNVTLIRRTHLQDYDSMMLSEIDDITLKELQQIEVI